MMDQAGRRRQVLLAWAFVQRNRGETVPSNDDLIRIAMARTVPPGLRTPIANRWAHVLHHLMWLSDQGHPDPVKDALQMAPAGPPLGGAAAPAPQGMPAAQSAPSAPMPHSAPSAPMPQSAASASGPPSDVDWAAFDRSANWRTRGPFDLRELGAQPEPGARVDCGSLLVPVPGQATLGFQRLEAPARISAVTVTVGGSIIELSAWAAPRTPGFWARIRQSLLTHVRDQGGRAECREGPFGTEVISQFTRSQPDGTVGPVVTRTWVAEGPEWVLRGVVGGEAALRSNEEAALLLEVFRGVVVRRPEGERPDGELLPLSDRGAARPDGALVPPSDRSGLQSSDGSGLGPAGGQAPPSAQAPPVPPPPGHASMPPQPPVNNPAARATEPPADPLQRLMLWRNEQGLDDLKDRHLRQIISSGARTIDEVATSLPASLKRFAEAIGAVLSLSEDRPESVPQRAIVEPSPAPAALSAPTAAPAAAPGPPATTPATPPQLNAAALTWEQPGELAEALSQFAAMDFTQPIGEPIPLRVSTRADGALTLRWVAPSEPAAVQIYRVITDDAYAPVSPDMAEVIAITEELTLTDPRPNVSAVRHYQVWVNAGASRAEALLEQPRLIAALPVVAKPADIDIREDEGRVIGQWTLFGDVRRVQIFRVPAEHGGRAPGDPAYRICADTPNLSGFVDDDAEPGRRYLYQLLVEAEVNGTPQLSLPTVVQVTTSAVLHPVEDLTCTLGDDETQPRFDLVWTAPPAGRVVIYRTPNGPRAGADAETVDESALPQMGLRPEDRLAHPIDVEDGRGSMRAVPWPRGWSRTYFTPVTMVDGQVRVGRTTSQVRTSAVTDARIAERVTQQVLTMDWPAGAAAIKVYASHHDQPAAEAIDGAEPIAEISADAYVRLGGLHFARPLDAGGCDLHLLPISFAGGQAVAGRPTTVRYRGLLKLWYAVETRRSRRGQTHLWVRIRSDRPNPTSPAFALVHNPDRLPLDINDGQPILTTYAVDGPQTPSPRFWPSSLTTTLSEPGWIGEVTGLTGFVRVFVDMPRNPEMGTVALIDPAVGSLYLGGR